MKTNFFLVMLCFIMWGCSKKEIAHNQLEPTTENPLEYCTFHFKNLGEGVAEAIMDKSFLDNVYSEIDKKFDGEASVLVKNIFPLQEVEKIKNSKSFFQSLEAFYNIENASYYPNIYIPSYDELKHEDKLRKKLPYIVFFVPGYDEERVLFDIYQVENGQLILQDFKIDESFAETNEVWVISLNETVDNDGNVPAINLREIPENVDRTTITVDYRLDKMTVKKRKDSGLNGKDEVSIRGFLVEPDGTGNDEIIACSSTNVNDNLIRKFSKSEINNQVEINVNFPLHFTWSVEQVASQNETGPNSIIYVIFECDVWPASAGTATINELCVNDRFMQYRSWETYYDKGAIHGINNAPYCPASNFWAGYSVLDSDIEFTTKVQ